MSNLEVTRTERGWAGHFICAHKCLFRRNTLLECGDARLVVSTVGLMRDDKETTFESLGIDDRFYETMAFQAHKNDVYWEADVSRGVSFDSNWSLPLEGTDDNQANDMHEAVVNELTKRLAEGWRGE